MKPIIFCTDMVRAIQDGRKTMTRRVIKHKALCDDAIFVVKDGTCYAVQDGEYEEAAHFSPYQIGDVLWVREAWQKTRNGMYIFRANADKRGSAAYYNEYARLDGGWKPSIHMPRAAARLFLRVTDVDVERVQNIPAQDVIREGVCNEFCAACLEESGDCEPQRDVDLFCGGEDRLVDAFADLWDRLNAERGYGWEVNPWVWVVSFERCEEPEGSAES